MPKFLAPVNLNKNELQNARLQNLPTGSEPGTPVTGQIYYNSTTNRAYYYNGSAWVGMDSVGATMTGSNIITAINDSGTTGTIDIARLNSTVITESELTTALGGYSTTSHNHTLDSLSNVTITSNSAGELLKWSGTAWINNTLAEAGIQPAGTYVTSVTGTSPVSSSGGTTPAISLASGYGDTQNPYASKTANYFLAAPNGSAGAPTFRAIVAADIPTLNQNTTGTAANVTGTVAIANGGTGQTAKAAAYNALSPMTTLGDIEYHDGSNGVRLAGNTTTTKKFLRQTGNGSVSAAPAWDTVTATDVGLSNLTNNKQIVATADRTVGYIPTWANADGASLDNGYSVETTLTGGSTAIARADAVKTYIDSLLAASDAMVFKGTVGTGGTHTIAAFNALVIYNAGWTYKVIEAGTIKGNVCQIGDMLVSTVDRASGGVDADWVVLQTNIDGAVTGPASATSGNFATFNGTTGKLIQDSGLSSASFAAYNATTYVGTTAIPLNRSSANQAVTGILSVAFAGATSGTITLIPTAVAGSSTLTMPATTGTLAVTGDIKDATLTLQMGAAAATNNTVTVGTGTGFSANASSNATYSLSVGPALSALATAMTGAGSGFLKKTAQDTYSVDTTTYGRKSSGTISVTTAGDYPYTHNLGTNDVIVAVYDSTNALVYPDIATGTTGSNEVTISFGVASSGTYRVVVIG